MEQRLNFLTLGVADVARARAFYERLGWRASPASLDALALFDLGAFVLALHPRGDLAEDAGLPREAAAAPAASADGRAAFGGIALAHNVRTRDEVDAVLAQAQAAGATITRPADTAPWGGYRGYFADPDGHPWEVCFNPGWPLDEQGRLQLR